MFKKTIYEFPVKKEQNPPPLARSCAQDKSSWAARSAVFRDNSKWWTKIHTRLTWVFRVKKVIQQFYWLITFFGFIWGSWVRRNYTKMLRNPTLVYNIVNLHILAWDQKKFLFFRATFGEITGNFLENLEQLVESPNRGCRLRRVFLLALPSNRSVVNQSILSKILKLIQ